MKESITHLCYTAKNTDKNKHQNLNIVVPHYVFPQTFVAGRTITKEL